MTTAALGGDLLPLPLFSRGFRCSIRPDGADGFRGRSGGGGGAVRRAGFGAFVERTNFHVKEIDLFVPGLHPDLEGLRIVQFSDLHVSPFLSVRELGRVVDMLNELKPHLTVVTGDLITQAGDPLDDTIRELAAGARRPGAAGLPGQPRSLCALPELHDSSVEALRN